MATSPPDLTVKSTMPAPSLPPPSHRSSQSVSGSPASPIRTDSFKRFSQGIDAPGSTAHSRPNSIFATAGFEEEPSVILSRLSSPQKSQRASISSDPNNFLTALATQERRVLELREELQKAEAELTKLKSHWAAQEVTKKKIERRNERNQVEPMRPLTSPVKSARMGMMDRQAAIGSPRLSLEDERKKAMYIRTRIPERRVFEGRHARALSLLSPGTLADRDGVSQGKPETIGELRRKGKGPQPRLSEMGPPPTTRARLRTESNSARDDLVNTGKQLVGDLREGLWSFLDDLRQATVGDEALKEPPRRRGTSKSPARPPADTRSPSTPSRANSSASVPTALKGKPAQPQPTSKLSLVPSHDPAGLDDSGWSNWDSAGGVASRSTVTGSPTPGSTPRTSVGSDYRPRQDDATDEKGGPMRKAVKKLVLPTSEQELPWPALTKLSPGHLTRTASHLMREWEKSLTPPADERDRDWLDKMVDGVGSKTGLKG